jgi:hypothetical protein
VRASEPKLLPRDDFRHLVFERDEYRCVVCKLGAMDAHHLIERRLWPNGGYYLDNGVSLCGACHLKAEQTVYSVEQLREFAGITRVVVPPHFEDDQRYDKWGNPILASGMRAQGELFHDPSVREVLKPLIKQGVFQPYVKYPRTPHLPWSNSLKGDARLASDGAFHGREVVVTEKMDGENTTMYRDHLHARSIDAEPADWRTWVKNFWAAFAWEIPEGMRICGENVYRQRSIGYAALPSYFLGFSVWERNRCFSWDETLEWFALFDIEPVPVLYRGRYDPAEMRWLTDTMNPNRQEGYVVRLADSFTYPEFGRSVAKYVRPNHVDHGASRHGFYHVNGLRDG